MLSAQLPEVPFVIGNGISLFALTDIRVPYARKKRFVGGLPAYLLRWWHLWGICAQSMLFQKWSGYYELRFLYASGSRLVADASVCDEEANMNLFTGFQQVSPYEARKP